MTSGSDYKISDNFVWCSANSTPMGSHLFWKSGEPNAVSETGAEESCVTLTIESGVMKKNVISDVICSESFKYICEVIDKILMQQSRLLSLKKVPVPPTTRAPCMEFTCQPQVI